MTERSVLICGASIAGPALAFWLRRHGFRPVVVERAPVFREHWLELSDRPGVSTGWGRC